ncbi:hypothetical protein DYB36_011144 [Aphanomyces astaci]|uniref:GS catalytic domain-containing protein n=1 Tax=Aphanomyces astaci TaxID=112090 RepID=A0A397AS27_APHAT|nr:hypothetical protein DYB36_011144 [Aphanomyces astaci]
MAYADILVPNCGLTSSEDLWVMPDVSTIMYVLLGLDVYCGFENEFNLYTAQNEPVDSTSYCQTLAINQSATFLDDLVEAIADIGAPLWLVHPEACVGQFEVTLTKLLAMEAADMQLYLREIIKGVAFQNGYQACFLPKPFEMQAGNGAHLHLSLWRGHDNLTTDLPPLVKLFMAGILAHLDGILAVIHGDPHALSDLEKARCKVTRLPTTLGAALDAFEADQVLVDALGARQAQAYVAVKRAHFLQFQSTPLPEFVQTFRTKF